MKKFVILLSILMLGKVALSADFDQAVVKENN